MVIREPMQIVIRVRKRNRMSIWETGMLAAEYSEAATPSAMIPDMYGFAYRSLLKVVPVPVRKMVRFW